MFNSYKYLYFGGAKMLYTTVSTSYEDAEILSAYLESHQRRQ